jgi:hypothetical protein
MTSRRVLSGEAVPAGWADPVHHGVIQSRVIQLEIDPVASEPGHPQNVPAFGARVRVPWVGAVLRRAPLLLRGDKGGAGHVRPLSVLWLKPSPGKQEELETH